ncbi:MAG TPA: hemolysin family protein [Kofleriaceae bacterium]|nr:hemolysin family protein [Kofleriaceae bacterium]
MDPVAILVIALLIGLNALFVAAEFAVIGAPPLAAREQARTGNRWAVAVARIARDPRRQDRYIATAQLGITGASLALGMYGESQLATWLHGLLAGTGGPTWLLSHGAAGALAVLLLSFLHIVLGEMMPKAVALADPLRAALRLAALMRAFELAFYPVVVVLNLIGNALLRLFGIERRFGAQQYTAEELQDIVWESEEEGLLGPQSAQVLAELVDFGQTTAREAMIPRVQILGIETGAASEEVNRVVRAAPHTRYPVYAHDLDHIVGTVHIKDLIRRLAEGRTIRQSDVRPIPFVPGSATLDTVLETLRRARSQMAVVMDEHGGTDGLITTEDLFEEVVGNIEDEVTAGPPDRWEEPGGALVAAGTVRVEEVGEHFDIPLEHEEVDTVSGLVLAELDRPPEVGDRVSWGGLDLEVIEVEGHGVSRCRITRPPPIAPSGDGKPEDDDDEDEGSAPTG